MKRRGLLIVSVLALLLVVLGGTCVSTYNGLVTLDQAVEGQWSQVENAYQRRADLVPNLVQTVKGAAAHERETLEAVAQARAQDGSLNLRRRHPRRREAAALPGRSGPAVVGALAAAGRQRGVSAAPGQREFPRPAIAARGHREPDLRRTPALQRGARAFNTRRATFPTVVFAGLFGDRFATKSFFTASAGAAQAPKVEF